MMQRPFVGWISTKDGRHYRLPTETEWEYACKGGDVGSDGGGMEREIDTYAWYKRNAEGRTHDVGLKKPNACGVYDMLGNVWEWTSSPFQPEIEVGNMFGGEAVYHIRGGSFMNSAEGCRCSARWAGFPRRWRVDSVGFRMVCDGGFNSEIPH